MKLSGKRVGFAITGSFCTFQDIVEPLQSLVAAGADVYPIMSQAAHQYDTKFGASLHWRNLIEGLSGRSIIHDIVGAEPIGPGQMLDLIIVAPCTGNTLAKLANAVTDSPVTMAAKAHLRNGRPVLLAIATNDGLGQNAKNIGLLLAAKHFYFVPFGQDNARTKPTSLIADMKQIKAAAELALEETQLQPILITH